MTSFGIAKNPAQMLEAKSITGRDERGRRRADRNLGLATLREYIPLPRQELTSAKEQLLHKCPELCRETMGLGNTTILVHAAARALLVCPQLC